MKLLAEQFFENIQHNPNTNDNVFEIPVKDYLNLSEKKKIFEGNINMNVKVMEYDRIKINEQSPDVRDFNGLIEPNSPTE
jgi:hypothetical protein